MTAKELYQAGKLDEAVQALSAELRSDPTDARRRTFLFELLCFAGDYDRAEKQLDVLAQSTKDADMGALVYRAALHAERLRQELFQKRDFPAGGVASQEAAPLNGLLNGKPFSSIEDADPRVGRRLEVFAAGAYLWIPLQHVASVEIPAPKRLRDLLWTPALVRTGAGFKGTELGEVLLPVLSPFSWKHSDGNVRLGRATEWQEENEEVVPVGQKMFLVDDEEVPILENRKLEFVSAEAGAEQAASN
jgi:type VI secretion system protein ImpE